MLVLSDDPARLASRLLEVVEHDVVPLTRVGVGRGDKVFGAAVLHKSDGSLVVADSNRETDCPLWHGEVATIKAFHERLASRPDPKDCLFLSTHEPCSRCLSAITWAGFDNFYYLFSYEDSRDSFAIPHDLRILEEVFDCSDGGYAAQNTYWKSRAISELIAESPDPIRDELTQRVERLRGVYDEMSETYQASKTGSGIPLA
ncbi:MAG: nucleoside deaminase [Acidobacteriota bacterium]|nr:nucleoside deaminase [Acidobacteriota bacterium]